MSFAEVLIMPKSPLTVRLPEINGETPLREEIKAIAKEKGVPTNKFVLDAICRAIAEHKSAQTVL